MIVRVFQTAEEAAHTAAAAVAAQLARKPDSVLGLPTGRELLVGMHEGLLRDVVGVSGVAEDGERARECGAAMATHEYRKGVLLPRQRSVNQLVVARLGRHVK